MPIPSFLKTEDVMQFNNQFIRMNMREVAHTVYLYADFIVTLHFDLWGERCSRLICSHPILQQKKKNCSHTGSEFFQRLLVIRVVLVLPKDIMSTTVIGC